MGYCYRPSCEHQNGECLDEARERQQEKHMTHTPGPWRRYVTPYQGQVQIRDADDEIIIAAVPEKGNKVQCSADARLIAAAPELLVMLQRYVNRADSTGEMEEIEEARALLARIDGEG